MAGRADGRPTVGVVIPAYQAAATIGEVAARTRDAVPGAIVYVVDDGSTDGTGEKAQGTGAIVLTHRENCGKGAALATGIAAALESGADVIVTLDGDGQHPPEAIPLLVTPVTGDEADVALGARARTGAMPLGRRCSNWLSAALASRVAGGPVPDAQTGFRGFARGVAEAIRPRETRYDFEAAFLLEALARGLRVRSVPVPTVYEGRPSHFRHWGDAWRVARVFGRYRREIFFGAR